MSAHSEQTKSIFAAGPIEVDSPAVHYTSEVITSEYKYETTAVSVSEAGRVVAKPVSEKLVFETQRKVPRLGVMVVGWGGNNGSTFTAGILANKHKLTWRTKAGVQAADYLGSVTKASTVRLGSCAGRDVYVPFCNLLPMSNPEDWAIGGWDISRCNLADAMARAEVLDYDLQRQLQPLLEPMKPLPSIYYPDFIAANQSDRADNLLPGEVSKGLLVPSHVSHYN
jgi:myo-inositol-1-phosphate synthase